MLTRPVNERHYSARNTVPVPAPDHHERGELLRGGAPGIHLPRGGEPMMDTGNGRVIPAAQDPTDPSTWRVPVVFT